MTRLISTIVFILLLSANVAAQTETSPWVTLAPEGAGFSILMPGKAEKRTIEKPTYTLHTFTINVGPATYAASYADYKPGAVEPTQGLAANRDSFVKGLRATLVSSREITVDGHTGMEVTCEISFADIKAQIFMIGNRMFQTATFVRRDVDETRNVDRFFESFKLLKPKSPI